MEKRDHRSYYLMFKGDHLPTTTGMIADFLDELDQAGFAEQCQTEVASC